MKIGRRQSFWWRNIQTMKSRRFVSIYYITIGRWISKNNTFLCVLLLLLNDDRPTLSRNFRTKENVRNINVTDE